MSYINNNNNASTSATANSTTPGGPIDYNYVDEESVSDDLKCSICISPLNDPILHPTCQNMFCRSCFSLVKNCPLCRDVVDHSKLGVVPRFVLSTLNEIRVFCPSCSGVFPRGKLAQHVQKCPISCPLGCGQKIAPDSIKAHESVCPSGLVCCSLTETVLCPWKGTRKQLEEHSRTCVFNQVGPAISMLLDRINKLENECKRLQRELARKQKLEQQQQQQQASTAGGLQPGQSNASSMRQYVLLLLAANNKFDGANFEGLDLSGANLSYKSFIGASFQDANLSGANFTGSNLLNADLSYANLKGANFTNANMNNVNLDNCEKDAQTVLPETKNTFFFTRSYDFDENGIIYWLGSNGKQKSFSNPAGTLIAVSSSAAESSPQCVLGRTSVNFFTKPEASGAWITLDFTPLYSVRVTEFTLRHGHSQANWIVRTFEIHGSNDNTNWDIISKHTNDTSITGGYGCHSWVANYDNRADNPARSTFYRYIRVKQTGPQSDGGHSFCCCGIELYGGLRMNTI